MNRSLPKLILAGLLCLAAGCTEKENTDNAFASLAESVTGEYMISEMTWSGLPIDLNHDGKGERDLLHEFSGTSSFVQSWIKATVEKDSDNALAFSMIVPVPSCSYAPDGSKRNTIGYVEITDIEKWTGSKLSCSSMSPSHWTDGENEEAFVKDIGDGTFTFGFRTSIYDESSGSLYDGRIEFVFNKR